MTLLRRQFLGLAAGAMATPLVASGAIAQAYPSRPVRVLVPVAPGGANDTATRLVMQKLSEALGQNFVVENHPGGGGNIGMGVAAKAAPDGYALLSAASSFMINPNLYAKIPYDPIKDFAPVTLMCSTTHVVVVHPSVPAKTIQELVALIKANPGKYNFASAGTGTPAHLAGELFKASFALDITHVPFGGGGPAMTSVIGGHTPIGFSALSTGAPNIKAGSVRALALMSGKRSPLLPDVPTMAEAGAPGQEADVMVGILAPAATPREIVETLHREIVKVIARAEVKERMAALGLDPVANTPDEFAVWIKAEIEKWGKVIHTANLKPR
jgi:tripartite-type tricarboxylate transporter receptor subunit TctC